MLSLGNLLTSLVPCAPDVPGAIPVNLAVRGVTLYRMWDRSWSLFSLAYHHITRSLFIWLRACCSIVKAMNGATVRRLVIGRGNWKKLLWLFYQESSGVCVLCNLCVSPVFEDLSGCWWTHSSRASEWFEILNFDTVLILRLMSFSRCLHRSLELLI